jgi:hypothetical protein
MVRLIGGVDEGLIEEFIKFYTSLICPCRLGTGSKLLDLFSMGY